MISEIKLCYKRIFSLFVSTNLSRKLEKHEHEDIFRIDKCEFKKKAMMKLWNEKKKRITNERQIKLGIFMELTIEFDGKINVYFNKQPSIQESVAAAVTALSVNLCTNQNLLCVFFCHAKLKKEKTTIK